MGGVSRGRADAELIWGEETPGHTGQFEAEMLERSKYSDPESSVLIGVATAQPQVDARPEGSSAAEVDASTGNSAWRRRLSPRHRRAVSTFFTHDRSGNPSGSSSRAKDDD